MSGTRYSSVRPLDFCEHPIRVLKDGQYIHVPCGKCNGCLLHKANHWSQRVSSEIENTPFSIFFTLTYDNFYLPTLVPCSDSFGTYLLVSDHLGNVRWNGSKDVLRKDGIMINSKDFIPIQNDSRSFTVNYASKRDIQLWLKLLRLSLDKEFYEERTFRYYIISEVGPTTSRNHFHGVIFPDCKDTAEFLLDSAMYENWKMCDHLLFKQYTKYCDPGTSCYVANYSTNINNLPRVYQEKSIRPFRLSSKDPGIGFIQFNKEEVFEKVSERVIDYTRRISRVDQTFVLEYPQTYMHSLFPKCYEFSLLSFERLLWIYGRLFRQVRGYGCSDILLSRRLREELHSADYTASLACFKACEIMGCTPFHYLYLLDMYYYISGMRSLSRWYEWQESMCARPAEILKSYVNFSDYVKSKNSLSSYQLFVMRTFCEGFCIDFDTFRVSDLVLLNRRSSEEQSYSDQVADIVLRLSKQPKVNELTGNSPHII